MENVGANREAYRFRIGFVSKVKLACCVTCGVVAFL